MSGACYVNGSNYSYPTREACFEAGGIPVDEHHQPPYRPDEIIQIFSGPTPIEPELEWQITVHQFVSLDREEDCSIDQTAAADQLESLAIDLFQQAFIEDGRTDSDLADWQAFVRLLNRYGANHENVNFLIRLTHPRLLPEDRGLLFNFYTADEQEREAITAQVRARIRHHFSEANNEYNGWQGRDFASASTTFPAALDAIGDDELYGSIASAVGLTGVFREFSGEQMTALLEMPEQDFVRLLDYASGEFQTNPVGSEAKIAAYRRLNALMTIAQVRGFNFMQNGVFRALSAGMPGLTETDYENIYFLSRVAHSYERTDNDHYRELFADQLQSLQSRFINAELGSEERISLAGALESLYSIAPQFGFEYSALDALLDFQYVQSGRPTLVENSLASLDQVGQDEPVTVSPQGLPREVVEALRQTGHYDLVADNIREIVFTTEINDGIDEQTMDSRGMAAPAVRLVQVDLTSSEGERMEPWQVAAVLVHEASHVAWRRRVTNANLLRSTPNERQAFLQGANFLDRHLRYLIREGLIDQGSDLARRMAIEIVTSRLAARGANIVLDYSEDNLEIDQYQLPSAEFIAEHGIASVDELDLEGYPTDLALLLIEPRFDQLINSLELSERDRSNVRRLFQRILNNEHVFEGYLAGTTMRLGLSAALAAVGDDEPLPAGVRISYVELRSLLLDLLRFRETQDYLRSI